MCFRKSQRGNNSRHSAKTGCRDRRCERYGETRRHLGTHTLEIRNPQGSYKSDYCLRFSYSALVRFDLHLFACESAGLFRTTRSHTKHAIVTYLLHRQLHFQTSKGLVLLANSFQLTNWSSRTA